MDIKRRQSFMAHRFQALQPPHPHSYQHHQKMSSSNFTSFVDLNKKNVRGSGATPRLLPRYSQNNILSRYNNINIKNNINSGRTGKSKKEEKVFKFKCTFSATICDAMKRRGWVQADEDSDDWDIFWCDMNQLRDFYVCLYKPFDEKKKIAHFRNNQEISRKHAMYKNLKRLRARVEKSIGKEKAEKYTEFCPITFVLPMEHKLFLQEYKKNPGWHWIIKPAAGAQGKGIFIFQKIKDYFDWRIKFDWSLSNEAQKRIVDIVVEPSPRFSTFINKNCAESLSLLKEPHPSFMLTTSTKINDNDNTETKRDESDFSKESLSDSQFNTDFDPDPLSVSDPNDPTSTSAGHTNEITAQKADIFVIQRYISNPYLIGGRKFDLRFFVLVTSFFPLKAYLYREGFTRFSAGQFSLESLEDIYIHLTNVSIQKLSEDYDYEKGSKWSIWNLREHLTAMHGNHAVQHLMNQIDTIVLITLQSVHLAVHQDKNSFEIYGFDVIIDSLLKPWLLEVNSSPSFTPSNEEDYRLKCAIIDDTVNVLDLEERLTGFEKRIGNYDLFWNDGPVYANPDDCCYALGSVLNDFEGPKLNTFLGCENNRVIQLREMFQNAHFIKEAQKIFMGSSPQVNTSQFFAPEHKPKVKDLRYKLPDKY